MTRERRDELLIGALVISLVVHIVMMVSCRPLVMTELPAGSHGEGRHPPMRIDNVGPRPAPVKIEAVADAKPTREAPKADAPAVEIASRPTIEAPKAMPVPVMTAPELARPKESSPLVSVEKIRLEKTMPVQVPMMKVAPPKASGSISEMLGHAHAVPAGPKVPAAGTDVNALFLPRQPKIIPELVKKQPEREKVRLTEKVMDSVDEKVVESEKAAVRELIDSKETSDLASGVPVEVSSAVQGKWRYFRIRMKAKETMPIVSKDMVLIIDASGSIGKSRMPSIRNAAKRLLRQATNTGDRFNVVAFRDKFTYAYRSWQPCQEPTLTMTEDWIDKIAAHGRTDVFSSIRSVLTLPRDPKRPLIALMITDAEANAGITRASEIITRFTELNDGLISLYVYGVKSSANRELIDLLTHGSRGEGYVYRGDAARAGEAIDGFSSRFRDPVLSDLRLVMATGSEAEIYPSLLPNIYRGGTVEAFGRVPADCKEVTFEVKGLSGTRGYSGIYKKRLDTVSDDPLAVIRWKEERQIAEQIGKE